MAGATRGEIERAVRKYSDKLVLFTYCITGDYPSAEDAAADAFAALILKPKEFDSEKKFVSYLYKTARSRAIDAVRRRQRFTSLDDLENLLSVDDERTVFVRENEREIYLTLQKLPMQYRNVLCLKYFDGLEISEIAKILKKSSKQVYNLLARAKSELRKYIEEDKLNEIV